MSEHVSDEQNLTKALLAAQREIIKTQVEKTGENDHFKSRFAELPNVIDAVIPILNKHGIVVLQMPVATTKEGYLALATTLAHEDGGQVSGTAEIPLSKSDPQAFGSALTYGRRYALCSILGLKTVDDDAEGAMGRGKTFTPKAPPVRVSDEKKPSGFPRSKPSTPTTAKAPVRGKAGLFPKVQGQESSESDGEADNA